MYVDLICKEIKKSFFNLTKYNIEMKNLKFHVNNIYIIMSLIK